MTYVEIFESGNIHVDVEESSDVAVIEVEVGLQGPQGEQGIPGPSGTWEQMTQAEFDALPIKDPDTLYVIIG